MTSSGNSDAQWQARQDLAACYRLIAHDRMTAEGHTYTLDWAALTRMLDPTDTSWRD